MTDDLPEPLTPADCDLRGLPFMPFDVVRVIDSDLYAISSGDGFKAAVTLWCKAWLQVPAASIPNDDRVLAHLSGAGSKWKKVRAQALHGFVLCADGRLYHPVVAQKAAEAWGFRQRQRERSKKGNDRRWGPSGDGGKPSLGDPRGDPRGDGAGYAIRDATGHPQRDRKGQGQGQEERKKAAAAAGVQGDPGPDRWDGVLLEACRAAGLPESRLVNDFSLIAKWAALGYEPADVLGHIREWMAAPGRKPPRSLAYFTQGIGEYRTARLAAEQASSGKTPWPADMPEPPNAAPLNADYQRWRSRASSYATGRTAWVDSVYGPPPGDPDCRMPADLRDWCMPLRAAAQECAA